MIALLKEIRRGKKMKQQDLAKEVGIDAAHLCLIERGKVEPKIELVLKMIKALGYNWNLHEDRFCTCETRSHVQCDVRIEDGAVIHMPCSGVVIK